MEEGLSGGPSDLSTIKLNKIIILFKAKNFMSEIYDFHYNIERLADFLFEAGMLKLVPRSGFAFLGSGKENIAEHSYRATVIGFILARMAKADMCKVMLLCLFHDLHEARTGDFNYVNHRYNKTNAKQALKDALKGTGLSDYIEQLFDEFCEKKSIESRLAKDADQIDLLCNLRVELGNGNQSARKWIENTVQRLGTPEGKKLAQAVLRADPNHWWQNDIEASWWINHGENGE